MTISVTKMAPVPVRRWPRGMSYRAAAEAADGRWARCNGLPPRCAFAGQNPTTPISTCQLTRACHVVAEMADLKKQARGHRLIRAPSRGFVPWRFSDTGRRACRNVRHGRRPKIFTQADISSGRSRIRPRSNAVARVSYVILFVEADGVHCGACFLASTPRDRGMFDDHRQSPICVSRNRLARHV